MFENLTAAEPDKILALIGMYKADPRAEKLDLGVGIYKDKAGNTPIMRSVQKAQTQLVQTQTTKAYLGLDGDRAFNHKIAKIALGDDYDTDRIRTLQTPGGSGALRIIAELLTQTQDNATIWVSDPTWANHIPVMKASGLIIKTYPYFDAKTGLVRFDAMMETLKTIPSGDIILLHGCCHNPTGANLTLDQWKQVGEVLVERNIKPFVDIAYQGFGDGLHEDAAGLRHLASVVPEMVVALSCSKNFAVYCDRVGAAIIMGKNAEQADIAMGVLKGCARKSYSMPPNHGAAAVRMILEDEALKADWLEELESMRLRMLSLRTGLADALRQQSNSDRFDFIATHRGMFSRLGLSPDEVEWLRTEHGIYIVGDSRINVAGLPDDGLDDLATKIVAAINQ